MLQYQFIQGNYTPSFCSLTCSLCVSCILSGSRRYLTLDMGLVMRFSIFEFCDQTRLELDCSATKTSYSIEILCVASLALIFCLQDK